MIVEAACCCKTEIGDTPCPIHDDVGETAPEHVRTWAAFLRTVEIHGPIPIRFRIHQTRDGAWLLESKMLVPSRDTAHDCEFCGRIYRDNWITFENVLPDACDDADRRIAIRQRVLGMFQHEALESIFVDGERVFDPHEARWYSNLVADWRYNL